MIGDGALTGGMAWEALNNIAVARDSRLVIVVNDNGRSYQPTIGGLASHLSTIRVNQRDEQVLDLIKTTVTSTPIVGNPLSARCTGEEGPEGLPPAAGAVRGPRHQVHRPGRRPRRGDGRARAAPGDEYAPPGAGARDHPQGVRLRAGRAERGGPPPPGPAAPAVSRPRSSRPSRRSPGPRVRRRDGRDRRPPPRHGGDHRRDAAPGGPGARSRPPTRTGSTTSASPSSTR